MSQNVDCTEVSVSATGIPIRNLWHMLLYAWNELRIGRSWAVEAESAPSLDALLATVLADLLQQRLRIGLGRKYRQVGTLINGVRGRIDFDQSLNRLAFQHGRAYCRFETYSPNVPINQIIRSTLARLAQVGNFGADLARGEMLRHRLKRLVRDLEMVELIELTPDFIRRYQLQRHDADYRLMLAVCHLVAQRQMPTEQGGFESLPALDRDAMTLYRVFEKFTANFYKARLAGWRVTAQAPLRWPATKPSYLPALNPDLVLQEIQSGRLVVLDTKFTAAILTTSRWGHDTFNRDHLFQIYAYLRSQDETSEHHRLAAGILLYPTVKHKLSEKVDLQGHRIRWESVDLSLGWEAIEARLLGMIASDSCAGEVSTA